METNFVKADSTNLPIVDVIMVGAYFINNPNFTAEFQNEKNTISAKESYGDDAIGYVQLRRESGICTIKCRVCTEYEVRANSYNVTMVVDENKSEIISCQCLGCTVSDGGCKHAVTFLMWAHRRSEKPSCEVERYWKKPFTCRVGNTKFLTLNQLCKKSEPTVSQPNSSVLMEFLHEANKRKVKNCNLLRYYGDHLNSDLEQFSLHHFLLQENTNIKNDVDKLLEVLVAKLDTNILSSIELNTRSQYKSPLWHELQYARIIASKVFQVSRCQTLDDYLVAAIMGSKTADMAAMKQKRKLKVCVLKTVRNKIKKIIRPCGLFISNEYPMIAATPDGICRDAVIVVKCPTNSKAKLDYINKGTVTKKYVAQMQLQMYVTSLKIGYFCVAHPDFKISRKVDVNIIEFDEDYVHELLTSIATFWKVHIYPLLIISTTI